MDRVVQTVYNFSVELSLAPTAVKRYSLVGLEFGLRPPPDPNDTALRALG